MPVTSCSSRRCVVNASPTSARRIWSSWLFAHLGFRMMFMKILRTSQPRVNRLSSIRFNDVRWNRIHASRSYVLRGARRQTNGSYRFGRLRGSLVPTPCRKDGFHRKPLKGLIYVEAAGFVSDKDLKGCMSKAAKYVFSPGAVEH